LMVGMDNILYTAASLNGTRVQVPSNGSVIGITQLNNGMILVVDTKSMLYKWENFNANWVLVANGGGMIGIAALAT
ncbi:unnamed protein product, partial [Adineta steineri]